MVANDKLGRALLLVLLFSPLTVCFHQCSIFKFLSSSTDIIQSVTLETDIFVQQNNSLLSQQLTTYVFSTCYNSFTSRACLLTVTCDTFKRIFCRLGISCLVIGNRNEVLDLQKTASNILNMQFCKLTAVCPTSENFLILK